MNSHFFQFPSSSFYHQTRNSRYVAPMTSHDSDFEVEDEDDINDPDYHSSIIDDESDDENSST